MKITISDTANGISPAAAPGELQRHETPDPVRSNAVEVRFHRVRQWTGLHDQAEGIGA
jgi:hypothetical protein